MQRTSRRHRLAALTLVLLSPTVATAQSNVTTGMVQGTVVDGTRAPLVDVLVEARNPDTGFARRAYTDVHGRYALLLLPPGTFELRTAHAELQTEVKRNVVVTLGSQITVDFLMRPAVFEDELVVTSKAPIIETTSSTVSDSISGTAIANLPLNGRNFSDFILLTPGAVSARIAGPYEQDPEARGTVGGVNVGARSVQNSFNIDGATAQSSYYGDDRGTWYDVTPFSFSQASIEEFQVIRSDYGLEFSAGGAVINAITKSGTNEIHGEVFGFYRDERFVGADAQGNEADDFRQLQYGFALGGPILRDRLHWFVSWDEQDFDEPTWRDFENFPADRRSRWEDLTGLDWERETGWLMGANDARVMLFKLDWQPVPNHLLTARYNRQANPGNQNMISPWEQHGWSNDGWGTNDYDTVVTSLNSVLSPRIMNEAVVQYSRETGEAFANSTSIPEVFVYADSEIDAVFGQRTYLPVELSESHWQLIDNLSFSVGSHLVQGGINFDFESFEEYWLQFNSGQYQFASWDDFFDGEPRRYQQAFSPIDGWVSFDVNTYAAYLQDRWRAAPKLSLIYGLRYDYQQHEQPETVNPLYPLTGQIPNDTDNVSARFGAAWDPAGDGKTVLRGGIGLFYDPAPTLFDAMVRSANGIDTVMVTMDCADGGCPTFPESWNSIGDLPPDSYPDIWVYDPQFENPQTLRMSVGYEREIFGDLSVGIDLVYSRSRNLQTKQDQNMEPTDGLTVDGRSIYRRWTVFPYFNKVLNFRSDGRTDARSLVLTARRRFSDGWFLDASYTWSSIRDNGSNQRSGSRNDHFPEDQYDIDADWGQADFDVRHKIVISGGVYLPYGFTVTGYVFARSGFPYSAFHRNDLNRDGYWESERSVIETEPGVFYHYPRNTFRQSWFTTTNLRLSKSLRLGRQVDLELIGEVFNLFNRANWFTTLWTLSYGCRYEGDQCGTWDDFGELNHPGSPREFQLGMKLRF